MADFGGSAAYGKMVTPMTSKSLTITRKKRAVAKRDFPPAHPGAILKEEFMQPLALSAYALAGATGMPRTRISDILPGRRRITADTALRLARYFGTDGQSWLNLQNHYDLEVASEALSDRLDREVKPRAA